MVVGRLLAGISDAYYAKQCHLYVYTFDGICTCNICMYGICTCNMCKYGICACNICKYSICTCNIYVYMAFVHVIYVCMAFVHVLCMYGICTCNICMYIMLATTLFNRYVVNYDFPRNIEDYVHRVGRTGRAG